MRDLTLERTVEVDVAAEALPSARGPLSARMLDVLTDRRAGQHAARVPEDPLGDDDLHLALALAYELSYRGLPGVRDDLEWDPAVLSERRDLEEAFEAGLRHAIGRRSVDPREVPDRLREIARPPGADSLSAFIEREATLDQAREFLMHRSAYQLKEADPHS